MYNGSPSLLSISADGQETWKAVLGVCVKTEAAELEWVLGGWT